MPKTLRVRARVTLGAVVEYDAEVTLRELSDMTGLSASEIVDMVEEGLIEASGRRPTSWRFRVAAVRRILAATRLQQDLGLNLAGAALVLELREDVRRLTEELERLRLGLPAVR